jgi:Fur family transcriptional regulator, ferric uptake regulator
MTDKNLTIQARHLLDTAGFNITKAQVLVLRHLLRADRPLSREELVEAIGEDCPDKVTIYRIMEKFCKKNIVHKAYLRDRAWKYELAHNCDEKQCHPHFTCTNCRKTFCLTDLSLPMIKGLQRGFIIHRQQVRIEGLCAKCS